jgi:membrane protein implicated in regulation of membrane protease activity
MNPVNWFILGFVLTVMEIIIPGFVIFWFGIAGVITGVISLFMPNLPAQIAIFVVLSGIMVFFAQKIARRWTKHSPESVGSERLHDAHGEVTARISPPDMGMVKVLGELWRAESDVVIEVGASVRVRKVVGNHVVVAPKTESQR